MFDFLLANVKPEAQIPLDSLWEKFTVGGGVFVRGMCTVFAVLAIIWLFLVIVRYFVYDLPNKRAAAATQQEPQEHPAAPAATAEVPATAASPDEEELVAVMAAAIAAAASAEAGNGKFRVVSFHRVNK